MRLTGGMARIRGERQLTLACAMGILDTIPQGQRPVEVAGFPQATT